MAHSVKGHGQVEADENCDTVTCLSSAVAYTLSKTSSSAVSVE